MPRKQIIIFSLLIVVTATIMANDHILAVPASAATVQDGKYLVPGNVGRKWIDTGFDLTGGAMVYLFADGKVDYGKGVGPADAAGIPASGVSGFPAETTYRYGLVARITSSRANPEDDLREDYAYGATKEFCVRNAGRLWLTVNDNEPSDNSGEYVVIVKVGTCAAAPQPTPQSTPDSGRGIFRVKITGFRAENVVSDGPFDAGDDVYTMWDAMEINADARIVRGWEGQSLVYGDINRRRTQVQAGTQGENGGIKTGDEIKGRPGENRPNRFPIHVADFELVDGANAIMFAPTIWVAKNDVGNYPRVYRQRFQTRARFAAYEVREILERNHAHNAQFHWGYSLSRGPDDWFEMLIYGRATGRDRPIGVARSVQLGLVAFGEPDNTILDFIPHTFLLTYKSVSEVLRSASGGSNQREVPFVASYNDSGPHGNYHLLLTIERVQ